MSAIILYRLLQLLGIPIIVVYFLVRGLKDRRYFEGFAQRLGCLPRSFRQTGHGAVWLHAVSVGEVIASLPLLRKLREQFAEEPIFVSSSTLAGKAAALDKLGGLTDGVFYAPLDYVLPVRRVLRTIRPRVVVVLETEIWPNLYWETRRAAIPLVVVNARISDRAMPRYRRLRWFFRQVLAWPEAILVQSRVSLDRFLELGAPPANVRLAGNLKYDFDSRQLEPPAAVLDFLAGAQPSAVWIAASTMPPAEAGDPDEDDAVIAAFTELSAVDPRLLLVLVPRRPERFESAAKALARAGIPFVRRSALPAEPGPARVLLVDSIGELASLFPLADVVFMGGTLAHRGGHNILEAAFVSRPVIVGPHMENFPEIAAAFRQAEAVVPIEDAGALAGAVRRLLDDPRLRHDIGARARAAADGERGACARTVAEIERLYGEAVPTLRPPAAVLLWPLSQLWLLASALRSPVPARLETPVISVGGLTVGGAGKTPVVLWLALRLRERGYSAAILTRGYRRRAAEPLTILAAGEPADAGRTGDEPQSFVRAALGPIGISADRAAAGRVIEERFHPHVFLLDDGFQHRRLARSLDLVVLDALDPFGGGAVVPLGRLREKVDALRRAGAVILTRTAPGRPLPGIEARIRKHNLNVPIFTARVIPQGWIDASTGDSASLPPTFGAFCGLGNPDSFWRSLRALGAVPEFRRTFSDHHRYTLRELRELVAPNALLTTEKDVANLPHGWQQALDPCRVLWLDIRLEVDQANELLNLIEAPLSSSSRNFLRSSQPP